MYRTVSQIDSAISILSTWFPQFFTRVQLPEPSVKGHPVYALKLRAGSSGARRGVLVVGGTHARELMNPDAIIDLAIDLFLAYTNQHGITYGGRQWSTDDLKVILESMEIWLVPCGNPDGREYVMTVDDMWRKNRRDNPGTTCDGVDLNRNCDIVWGVAQGQTSCSPCAETYCGPSAFSEPETRNIKYLLDTQRIVSFVDVHSYSELVLYPWGHANTQSTDPTKVFTTLPTGTCTASIPSTYSEYMTPRDVQRFQTVAARIVSDVTAVRGRHYTPQTSRALYPTTGSHGDYAYARHIANPSLQKTYGFTFETGPYVGNGRDSFHPPDPEPVKRDAKAAILGLLQQSVCAIELIGLTAGASGLAALRSVRDDLLATTAAGRQWIALLERAQSTLLASMIRDPALMAAASKALDAAGRALSKESAIVAGADIDAAAGLMKKLKTMASNRVVRTELEAVTVQLERARGRSMRQVIEALMRQRPAAEKVRAAPKPRTRTATKAKPSAKPRAKTKRAAPKKKAARASAKK